MDPTASSVAEPPAASWYGYPHHGRRTASGEVYDMRDLTAAHRTLPLGIRVMVTNVDNGQVVEVRINDRGPFVERRILDLSHGAARVLGAVGSGVIPVRLRVIALPGGRGDGGWTGALRRGLLGPARGVHEQGQRRPFARSLPRPVSWPGGAT